VNTPQLVPYAAHNAGPGGLLPPLPPGQCWRVVRSSEADEVGRELAAELVRWMPLYHYADCCVGFSLRRYFCFESGFGRHIGALEFVSSEPPPDVASMGSAMAAAGAMGQNPCDVNDPAYDPTQCTSGLTSADGGNTYTDGQGNTYVIGTGGSGGEIIPQPDGCCTAWTPTTGNAAADALANSISYQNTPVAWAKNTVFNTTIAGVGFRFVMYDPGDGLHHVAVFQCTPVASPGPTCQPPGPGPGPAPGPTPSPSSSGGSAAWVAAVVALIGLAAGGIYYAAH